MVFNISHVLISDLQRRRREEECSFGPRRGAGGEREGQERRESSQGSRTPVEGRSSRGETMSRRRERDDREMTGANTTPLA